MTADSTEIPVGQYVKTFDELKGGIPDDNLTILGLARKMASRLTRPPVPLGQAESTAWSDSQRANLRSVVRYHPVTVSHIMRIANTHHDQVESISYRFEMSNGLSATGVWLKEVQIRRPRATDDRDQRQGEKRCGNGNLGPGRRRSRTAWNGESKCWR